MEGGQWRGGRQGGWLSKRWVGGLQDGFRAKSQFVGVSGEQVRRQSSVTNSRWLDGRATSTSSLP